MTRTSVRALRRALTIGGTSAALLLVGAGIAAAHVRVDPGTVTAGSYSTLTFRVPTESDTASTTSVEIQIPAATPFPSVSTLHMAGWTVEATETDLPAPVTEGSITLTKAVTSVTFTAEDGGIAPHEFATFDLLVGPVPDVGSISFTAIQTYSDGSVVRWDQPTPADGTEPEYPAPTIAISPAAGDEGGHDHGEATATASDIATVTGGGDAAADQHSSDGVARLLGVAGILLAAVAIGVAASVRRKPSGPIPNRVLLGIPPDEPPTDSGTDPAGGSSPGGTR